VPEHDPSAFISYSREDSEFALRLAQDLKAAGAHVWLDQMDISPGVPWDNAIEDALNNAPQMLLVLSPSSSRSNNVRNEISFALEAGKIIIPVLYQDCVVPLRLQRNQRIDFRADYAHGLTTLLSYLHVQNPDPEVLERAASGDAQRRTAWEAREAEADRLRERQKQEESARQQEETERQQRDDSERAASEAEQARLREAAEERAIAEANRRTEAARVAEEKRKSEAAAAARQLQEQAQRAAPVAHDPTPSPTQKQADTHLPPPPPRRPEPPKIPSKLPPSPAFNRPGNDDGSSKTKWQPGLITVAALAVALLIAIIVIVTISHRPPSNATIVQGNGGSTDSGTQPATTPADTPTTPAPVAPAPVAPTPVAPTPSNPTGKRSTAPNANAKQQFATAQALAKQGNWVGASKEGELALSLDPQSDQILQFLADVDHEQLFKFERAYELGQMRVPLGYGQDDFVEASLTVSQFSSCINLAVARWKADTDIRLKIVMSALDFACLSALKDSNAHAAGSELRQEIPSLKAGGWTYNGTEHFVASSPAFAPNGATWVSLFQALGNGNQQAVYAALTALGVPN